MPCDMIGEPIADTIPDVVTDATAAPGEPGLGWTLSDEALRELDAIDENRRAASAMARDTILD